MKMNLLKIISVAIILLFVTIGCKKDKNVTNVTLDKKNITLDIGKTAALKASVYPEDAANKAVNWTSSNSTVADVVNGIVTAKEVGKTIITVITEDGNFTAECRVTVIPEFPEWVEISGVKWTTRNLAAHGKFVEKPEDYGALFQWGRKGDGHEQRTSPCYPTNNGNFENGMVSGSENFDTHGQIVNTHDAYGKFIKQSEWQSGEPCDWRSPQINALWNSGSEELPVKTTNDPCPEGWRVPTNTEQRSLVNAYSEWTTINGVDGRMFGSDDNFLFLPAVGYREVTNGAVHEPGAYLFGFYWSSSIASTDARYMSFGSTNVTANYSHFRARGFSVRCVAE